MAGWNDLYREEIWREWANRPPLGITFDWIDSLDHERPCRVFDMGCGLGRHTVLLAGRGLEVVASDPSKMARDMTGRKLEELGLKATIISADMTSIPYPDGHFHGVLSIDVLEHNVKAGIEKAIREIDRVLAPGGKVLASFIPRTRWFPAEDPKYDMIEDNTIRKWGPEQSVHHMVDEDELRELFSAFKILRIQSETETLTIGGSGLRSTALYISAEKKGRQKE